MNMIQTEKNQHQIHKYNKSLIKSFENFRKESKLIIIYNGNSSIRLLLD